MAGGTGESVLVEAPGDMVGSLPQHHRLLHAREINGNETTLSPTAKAWGIDKTTKRHRTKGAKPADTGPDHDDKLIQDVNKKRQLPQRQIPS